mgnify:CR=1 FL=1
MDELELLKKDWGKQDTTFKKLSANEIYPILQKISFHRKGKLNC